jgi:Coenzyme PQQ synthesis protein D (PqqD)
MSPARVFRVNTDEVASKVIEGEAILINLSNGMYYNLAGTGALVWALLETAQDDQRISAELERRTGIDHATAVTDVERLLDELSAEGLIVAAEAPTDTADPEAIDVPPLASYSAPVLEKYADMSDLLALDPPMPRLADIPWQPPAG